MAFTPIRVAKLAVVCIVAVSQLLVVAALPNAGMYYRCIESIQSSLSRINIIYYLA